MWKSRENYDPKIYGRLKADFLNNLAQTSPTGIHKREKDQEIERLKLLKEIKEGKLVPTQPPE